MPPASRPPTAPPAAAGRRPVLTWVATAVLAGLAALGGSSLRLDNDVQRMLPDRDPRLSELQSALSRLLDRCLVDLDTSACTAPAPAPAALAAAFERRLRSLAPGVGIQAGVDARGTLELVDLLRRQAPRLLPTRDLDAFLDGLDTKTVVARIRKLAQRLQEPDGAHLQATAGSDPLQLRAGALRALGGLAEGYPGARLEDGRMVSADGAHQLLILQAPVPARDVDGSRAFVAALHTCAAELRAAHPGLRVHHFGVHRATVDNVAMIKADITRSSALGVAAVAGLALLCFGRFWLSLLALLPGAFGGVLAWGIYRLFSDSVAGAVFGFAAVLLGITVDFAIHVLFRLDRHSGSAAPPLPRQALLLGGLTTALAFGSLQFSALPMLREIGAVGALGICIAVAFSLWVLPTLVRPRARVRRPALDLGVLVAALDRGRRPLTWAALGLTPLLLLGLPQLRLEGDPLQLSGMEPETLAAQAAIEAVWGRSGQLSTLIVEGEDLDAALQDNDRLRTFLDAEAAAGRIRGHASVAGVLPAASTQEKRLAAWQARFDPGRIARLRDDLRAACAATPFRAGAFDGFLRGLGEAPPPLRLADLQETALAPLLANNIQREAGRVQVLTPVFTDDWASTAALQAALGADQPEVLFLNKQAVTRQIAGLITGEIRDLALLACLAVALVIGLWQRRLRFVLAILLPLLLSLGWALGLMGWWGLPLSMANTIFVVFLFGVAVDYAIFLSASQLEVHAGGVDRRREAQASVLLCTLTTCAGFGSLALARHPVLQSIGTTTLLGILAAAVCTQLFIPWGVRWDLRRGSGDPGNPAAPRLQSPRGDT